MMKKRVIWIAAILYCCLLAASCDDNEESTCPPIIDDSLAGSIYIPGSHIKAEGIYNGTSLTDLQHYESRLFVNKVSDTELHMDCISKWGETKFIVSIPKIPLLGKPYDVTFDCISNDVKVTYDGLEYTSVPTSVKGWIKKVDQKRTSNYSGSDGDPAIPDYSGEITINSTLKDGKTLNLKITSWSRL